MWPVQVHPAETYGFAPLSHLSRGNTMFSGPRSGHYNTHDKSTSPSSLMPRFGMNQSGLNYTDMYTGIAHEQEHKREPAHYDSMVSTHNEPDFGYSGHHHHSGVPYTVDEAADVPAEVNDVESEEARSIMRTAQQQPPPSSRLDMLGESQPTELDFPLPARRLLNEIRTTGVIPVVPRPLTATTRTPGPGRSLEPTHNYPLIFVSDKAEDEPPVPRHRSYGQVAPASPPTPSSSSYASATSVQPADRDDEIARQLGLSRRRGFATFAGSSESQRDDLLHATKLRFGERPSLRAASQSQESTSTTPSLIRLGMKRTFASEDQLENIDMSPNARESSVDSAHARHHQDTFAALPKRVMRDGDAAYLAPSNIPVFYEDGYEEAQRRQFTQLVKLPTQTPRMPHMSRFSQNKNL